MKLVKIIILIELLVLITACNDSVESKKSIEIVEKENDSYSIPSFGKGKVVGCETTQKSTKEECLEDNVLSSSERILDRLSKRSEVITPSLEIKNSLKEEKPVLSDSKNSSSEQLIMLVEEHEIKEKNPKEHHTVKDDLEALVSSSTGSLSSLSDTEDLGRFDKEQFKSTWEELDALVKGSEDNSIKQESLKKELENLVIAAATSTSNKNSVDEVTKKKVKSLINISIEDSSPENHKFIEHIVSDISDKRIELLESNEQWIKIRIRSGDTLVTLAKNYYGDEKKYRIIYNANRNKIKDDYIIYVGDTLKIPTLNSIKGI